MLRTFTLVLAAFLSLHGTVHAVDWSIKSTVSERMEFDDNISVATPSPGNVVGSTTSLATAIAAKAKTYSIILDANLALKEYAGPGETRGLDSFNQEASLVLFRQTKLTDYAVKFYFANQDVATTEFEDTGLTNVDSRRLTYSADATIDHQFNRRNNLILSAQAKMVDFSNMTSGLTPYFDASTSLAWKHMMTRRTNATISGSLEYYEADNATDTTSWIFKTNLDVQHRWTKRLTVNGGIGANFVHTDKTTGSERSTGFSGKLGLEYRRKRTTINANLSHALTPSSTGELQNRTSAAFGISRKINSRSTLALNAIYSHQQSDGTGTTSRDTLSISPILTYIPARYWNTSLGYTYRYSETTKTAQSHKVFMSVSRSFTTMP